jgi:hypothetical protein
MTYELAIATIAIGLVVASTLWTAICREAHRHANQRENINRLIEKGVLS